MMQENTLQQFIAALASSAPVPGGGGASALVGSIGCALGGMVGSLTVGKKKYADVQEQILSLKERSDALQQELLQMMNRDAEVFEPLSKAYGLPKETPEQAAQKQQVMEEVLVAATEVPLAIMQLCAEAIALIEEYAAKGSAIAISDAGVGAVFCRAALEGASLNVFINTKSMTDRARAGRFDAEAEALLEEYVPRAGQIFERVRNRLR